jgi:hypothetical protein
VSDRLGRYLPRWMAGGPGNPLGARAMNLGATVYRIHGIQTITLKREWPDWVPPPEMIARQPAAPLESVAAYADAVTQRHAIAPGRRRMKPKKKLHIPIVTAMNSPQLFAPFFQGSSWDRWRVVLKAAFALPMDATEIEFFRSIAERDPPTKQVSELWIVAGRRAGKDSIASMISAHAAALFNQHDRLRRGERALVACLACNREQAQIVLGYVRKVLVQHQ